MPTDWLPEKTTISIDYFITELEELLEAIKCEQLSRKVIIQHNNARSHVSALTTTAIRRLGSGVSPTLPIVQTWLQVTTGCLEI